MTRTPSFTFKTTAHREPMDKITASEPFLVACDYALLMHAKEIDNPLDPTGLAQIIGARRVLEILKTIGEPIKDTKPARSPGLNYENP
jgi:hypothetical protein